MVSSYVETTLHIRVAIHVSVRRSSASGEYLPADETFAKAVTSNEKHLADLVASGNRCAPAALVVIRHRLSFLLFLMASSVHGMVPTHLGEERRIGTDNDPRRRLFRFRKVNDVETLVLFFHKHTVLKMFGDQLTCF
jgi:hypothetical protein